VEDFPKEGRQVKIRYVLAPLLLAPMIAVAQVAPQQPLTQQDQAWVAVSGAFNGVDGGVVSLKYALTQYQDRIQAVVRSQADQINGLQSQGQAKDAYWKSYVAGSDQQVKTLTDELAAMKQAKAVVPAPAETPPSTTKP
jgi:hypothetical protein